MKYRKLRPYDILREGDEFFGQYSQQWLATVLVGESVGDCPYVYRRPIKPKKKAKKKATK